MVDHGFIGGVMVSLLPSSVVDHGFIGGVIHYTTDDPMIYHIRGEQTNHYTTDEPMIYHTRGVDHGIIGGVMVSLSETKDYRIGISCFSFTEAHSIM
jgi:hypothetical protein